jgi:hypothetical protein
MIITYDQEYWLNHPQKWMAILPKLTGVEWCWQMKDLQCQKVLELIIYIQSYGLKQYFHFPHHILEENMSCILTSYKSPSLSAVYLNYIDQVYSLLPEATLNFVMHPLVSDVLSENQILHLTIERYNMLTRYINHNYSGSVLLETIAEHPWTIELYEQFNLNLPHLKRLICFDTVHAAKLGSFSMWSALYNSISYVHIHNTGTKGAHCGFSSLPDDLITILTYSNSQKIPVNLELLLRHCTDYEAELNTTLKLLAPFFND